MRPSPSLGICVVTYKERFAATQAYETLSRLPETIKQRLHVVSVCNAYASGEGQADMANDEAALPYTEILRADNGGLATGYNTSLPIVLEAGASAVLFLNADASVESWYIEWLFDCLRERGDCHGFAPTLTSRGVQVSPFRKRGMTMPFFIIGHLCLRAGPFLRALRFPREFWLDGIDYWLSAELSKAGMRVHVTDRTIEHNLSVSDQFDTLPAWRYRNILLSERTFLKLQQRPFFDICITHLRAMLRCLRYQRVDLARVVVQEFSAAFHDR